MSILSAAEKADVEGMFGQLHDTFARPIVYYKTPQEVVVSTSSSHNSFFQDAASNAEVTLVQQSGSMTARILYGQKNALESLIMPGGVSNNMILGVGECRIKLPASGAAVFEDAKRVTVDGVVYEIDTDQRVIGPFNLDWFSLYLKRVQ